MKSIPNYNNIKTMLDTVLTEKQLLTLREMLYHYKEFQLELYEYPDLNTLFTQTQLELFDIFDIK